MVPRVGREMGMDSGVGTVRLRLPEEKEDWDGITESDGSLSLPCWEGPVECSDCGRAEYDGGNAPLLLPEAGRVEDRRSGL